MYFDLKVESISSMGIERAALVATFFTSSGNKVWISMVFDDNSIVMAWGMSREEKEEKKFAIWLKQSRNDGGVVG